jgi:DNA polymerase III alpha subunit
MDSFLQKRVAEGIERRYGPKNDRSLMERAKKQVEHELKLIAKLGFAGYFLIVWDIIRIRLAKYTVDSGAAGMREVFSLVFLLPRLRA